MSGDWDRKPVAAGTSAPGTEITFEPITHRYDDGTIREVYTSYAVYVTPGWRRQEAATFAYMYPKTCLLPSVWYDEILDQLVTLPPSDVEGKTGGFWKRVTDAPSAPAFTEGYVARYLGDTLHDPPSMMIDTAAGGGLGGMSENGYRASSTPGIRRPGLCPFTRLAARSSTAARSGSRRPASTGTSRAVGPSTPPRP